MPHRHHRVRGTPQRVFNFLPNPPVGTKTAFPPTGGPNYKNFAHRWAFALPRQSRAGEPMASLAKLGGPISTPGQGCHSKTPSRWAFAAYRPERGPAASPWWDLVYFTIMVLLRTDTHRWAEISILDPKTSMSRRKKPTSGDCAGCHNLGPVARCGGRGPGRGGEGANAVYMQVSGMSNATWFFCRDPLMLPA